MTERIEQLVRELRSQESEVSLHEASDGFSQDVFETVDYWCILAQSAIRHDTRLDYPFLVAGQLQWVKKFQAALRTRSSQSRAIYQQLFITAAELLKLIAKTDVPEEGHLAIIETILQRFRFLQSEWGFVPKRLGSTGVRYSSGSVYLNLELAHKSYSSCRFGSEQDPEHSFYIEDLLALYEDRRYRTVPEDLSLESKAEIESWFGYLAGVFIERGREVLSDVPGIFDRLASARAEREMEYIAAVKPPSEVE